MGKAPKLLTIGVTDPGMLVWPEFKKLAEQGHTVIPVPSLYDMILGPNCWMMDMALQKYILLAVRAGRERKYKKKGVTHEVQDQALEQKGGGEEVSGPSEVGHGAGDTQRASEDEASGESGDTGV